MALDSFPIRLTPSPEFVPPVMALDMLEVEAEMIHGPLCPCAACTRYGVSAYKWGGQVEPDKAIHPRSQPGSSPDDFYADPIRIETLRPGWKFEEGRVVNPPARRFHWFRQTGEIIPKTVVATKSEDRGKVTINKRALEEMHGPATYDNGGKYVVLETTLDLEYAIIDTETRKTVKTIVLSLEDAKKYCDELNRIASEPPAFNPDKDIIKCDHYWVSAWHESVGNYMFCSKCHIDDWSYSAKPKLRAPEPRVFKFRDIDGGLHTYNFELARFWRNVIWSNVAALLTFGVAYLVWNFVS